MPHVKTYCRIKPTKNTYDDIDVSCTQLALRVPEVLKDFSATNKSSRSFINHEFNFDHIFQRDATQEEVFNVTALEIVNAFLGGYNGTIFAYGQTGTGKTYTVEGSAQTYQSRGLEPRALSLVYKELEKRSNEDLSIHISYLEIYQEVGYDLLNPGARTQSYVTPFPKVNVLEGHNGMCIVRNLSNHLAASEDVAQSLLLQGQANRKVAATAIHDRSSRSHAVFTIQMTSKKLDSDTIVRSKLHLVDLAGSERVAKTGVLGQQLSEAKSINLSLHYLETVIIALQQDSLAREKGGRIKTSVGSRKSNINNGRPSSADGIRGPRHVPYRNSLLTMLLRDSLGGNCMTSMIATVSLEISNLGESISTCRFAGRVACIANIVSRNEELDEKSLIKKLRKRIAELETELACLRLSQDGEGAGESRMVLTEEDKMICAQVVRQYLAGKIADPIAAGITNPFKFRECLRIVKRVVSKGGFALTDPNNNHRRNSLSVTVPRHSPTQDITSPDEYGEVNGVLKRKNVQKLKEDGEQDDRIADTSVNASHGKEVSHYTYKETIPGRPKTTTAWANKSISNDTSNHPASAPSGERVWKSNSKKDPETLSQALQSAKPRTPFEQKRMTEIKKLDTKVDKIQTERIEKEQEVLDLKIQVAEKELDLMERHMRTKLGVTTAQVEDQKAYVKQLTSTEADPGLIENEKLVEKQLRKRLDKFERQLEYIEHRREHLKKHAENGTESPEKKATVSEKFGQFRKRDGSMNTRQVFQMLKMEEKKQHKASTQVDRERLLASANLMEMKELATRQKLQELKEAMKTGSAFTQVIAPTHQMMNGHGNEIGAMDERQTNNGGEFDSRNSSAKSGKQTDDALTRESTNVVNYSDKNSGGKVENIGRPGSSGSIRSNAQVPTSEFYAKRKREKDPTNRWESNYTRPTTPSKLTIPESGGEPGKVSDTKAVNANESKVTFDENTQEKSEDRFYHRKDHERSREKKNEDLSEALIEAQSKKLEEELYNSKNRKFREKNKSLYENGKPEKVETLMPSEYVYGMSNTEQFDARRMDLSSKNFDSALNTMLGTGNDNAELFPESGNYEQYARTSKYRPNPYIEQQKITPPRQRSKTGQRDRPPTRDKQNEAKTPERKSRNPEGSPISAKIARYIRQPGSRESQRRSRERTRPSSAGAGDSYTLLDDSRGATLEIEEEHHGKVTAMKDQEREQTYMSKAQVERDRVNRIRKARKSAEVIQRAWRRFIAKKRRR